MNQLIFDQFKSLESLADLAHMLGLKKGTLAYILYGMDRDSQYKQFVISKKSGGERQIEAPTTALKTIQRRLGLILQDVYWRRPSAFGFVKGFSIKHNAARHCKKKFVFNLDLENFFHSIHFGRVRGLFAAAPISLPIDIATMIAQICCYDGRLPQGASTSPIISNMICTKLDRDLQKLAQSCRCHYTRYADDITFSTNNPIDIKKIWQLDDSQFNVHRIVKKLFYGESKPPAYKNVTVGKELNDLIEENGFTVNTKKVRLASSKERQEVTGLVVNRFPNVKREYIRRTRAILHSWRTQGLEVASDRFFQSGYTWNGQGEHPPLQSIVRGRIEYIGMVKGKTNPIYLKLLKDFFHISQGKIPHGSEARFRVPLDDNYKYVITEGKTDWKHIKAAVTALRGNGMVAQFNSLLYEYEEGEPAGGDAMLQRCRTLAQTNSGEKRLFVFDNDDPKVTKYAVENGSNYKHWGNNVFSTLLPVPDFRDQNEISIELLYNNTDLVRHDASGRRLYLNTEFDKNGIHRTEKTIEFGINPQTGAKIKGWPNKLKDPVKILDQNIVKHDGAEILSIALSKDAFASNILSRAPGFEIDDFNGFKALIDRINEIMAL